MDESVRRSRRRECDVEESPIEKLACDRSRFASADGGGNGIVDRCERAKDSAGRVCALSKGKLNADDDRERPFAPDEKIDELARSGVCRDAVPG